MERDNVFRLTPKLNDFADSPPYVLAIIKNIWKGQKVFIDSLPPRAWEYLFRRMAQLLLTSKQISQLVKLKKGTNKGNDSKMLTLFQTIWESDSEGSTKLNEYGGLPSQCLLHSFEAFWDYALQNNSHPFILERPLSDETGKVTSFLEIIGNTKRTMRSTIQDDVFLKYRPEPFRYVATT